MNQEQKSSLDALHKVYLTNREFGEGMDWETDDAISSVLYDFGYALECDHDWLKNKFGDLVCTRCAKWQEGEEG